MRARARVRVRSRTHLSEVRVRIKVRVRVEGEGEGACGDEGAREVRLGVRGRHALEQSRCEVEVCLQPEKVERWSKVVRCASSLRR